MDVQITEPKDVSLEPNSTDSLEDLEKKIESAIDKQSLDTDSQTPVETEQEQPEETQTPEEGKVDEVEDGEEQEQTQTETPETTQQDTEKQKKVTFDALQKKNGFKSVDDLAVSYSELRKKLTQQGQEISSLKNTVQPVAQPNVLPNIPNDPTKEGEVLNNWVNEGLANNPAETLIQLMNMVQKPAVDEIKSNQQNIAFTNELTRLSSNPKTIEFNYPEVQAEIQKVMSERPQVYLDQYGGINPAMLETAFYTAKGRLGTVTTVSESPKAKVNKQQPVEGATKPVKAKIFDPKTASADELEATIRRIQGELE